MLPVPPDAAGRVEQLRACVTATARYQEGETPAEDAAALLAEAGAVLGELEVLIRRINRTNAATAIEGGTRSPTRWPAGRSASAARSGDRRGGRRDDTKFTLQVGLADFQGMRPGTDSAATGSCGRSSAGRLPGDLS